MSVRSNATFIREVNFQVQAAITWEASKQRTFWKLLFGWVTVPSHQVARSICPRRTRRKREDTGVAIEAKFDAPDFSAMVDCRPETALD